MKKSVCFYFQVHQPTQLRVYRFFDIGKDSHYYDDFANRTTIKKMAQKCYLPMNELLLKTIKKHKGSFKVAFSISGSALEQFDRYAPEVISSFRALAETGCVEFVCESYNNTLASLVSAEGFKYQVEIQKKAIEEHFGVVPTAFCNTSYIYSDSIGKQIWDLGFKTVLTEGARHILGWKSPNHVYESGVQPGLNLLLRNYGLSDDISLRFGEQSWSEWPLTAEKYVSWIKSAEGQVVNLFMDYKTFGDRFGAESGIFDFMAGVFDGICKEKSLEFMTPSQEAAKHQCADTLFVEETISGADEERDLSAWLGNELQQDAFKKSSELVEKLMVLDDPELWAEFGKLQESNHFYYMCTKFFSNKGAQVKGNPYDTPFEAFINYMNVLNDFIIRLNNKLEEK